MHNQSLLISGRLPVISRAELESLLGADHVEIVGDSAVVSDVPVADIPFSRIGSTVKLAQYLGTISGRDLRTAQNELNQLALRCAQDIPEGKIQLGLSTYGVRTSPQQLMAIGLNLKKTLRTHGYSVRLTPNETSDLSSAQVIHNHLTGERGIELLVIQDGARLVVGRTVAVQDIAAYAARDQNRPKRDARVGMLPPKLAQTIVNLATASLDDYKRTILDPFCGTGVVLQEALLMGYTAYGTDLEQRMIDFSRTNLEWLSVRNDTEETPLLEVGDATSFEWQKPIDSVACETYLGQPLSSWPSADKLHTIIGTCNVIIEKFLRNIGEQLKPGTRLCLALPAWRAPNGQVHHLPLLDHLAQMGYNRVSFEYARAEDLIYYRADQLVARELLVITRK